MKRNAIARIIIFSILTLVLLGLLIGGIMVNSVMLNTDWLSYLHPEYSGDFEKLTGTGSIPAEEIENLHIEWMAGSITVIPADVDSIRFYENEGLAEKEQLAWSKQGDTLAIRFTEAQFHFGITVEKPKNLMIQVPKSWTCQELKIEAASAAVQITGMTIDTLDLDSASGACKMDDCHVRMLDMDTASGEIHFTGTLQKLECDAASANCILRLANTPNRIDADMVSGDLRLILPDDCGFKVNLDTVSGSFTSEFPTNTSNGSHIYGDQRCTINVCAVSGDVIIEKRSVG